MDLNESEMSDLINLLSLPTDTLKSFIKSIESYDDLPAEKQKYYDILMKLLIQYHKSKTSGKCLDSLLTLSKNTPDITEQINLVENFLMSKNSIFLCDKKRFVDLNWRLEAKVSSRTIHEVSSFEPKILLNVKAMQNEDTKNIHIEVNPSNLNHIISKLEHALIDSKNLLRYQSH